MGDRVGLFGCTLHWLLTLDSGLEQHPSVPCVFSVTALPTRSFVPESYFQDVSAMNVMCAVCVVYAALNRLQNKASVT